MNKSLFSAMGNKLKLMSLTAVAVTASTVGFSQNFVDFNPVSYAIGNSVTGTYTGGGTATVSFTTGGGVASANTMFMSQASWYNNNPSSMGGASAAQTFSAINNSYWEGYRNITFTFSTPVIVNELNISDIDKEGAGHNDRFAFSGVTFSNVINNSGTSATVNGSGEPPVEIVNGGQIDNYEHAKWTTSTTPVTSFTISFNPQTPGYGPNAMAAWGYLQFSIKVTPTINIHGSIYHDNNGNIDNLINNGPKLSTASGQQLYAVAYRVSDMTVLGSQPIINGDYNMNLPRNAATSNYVVVLTTQNPAVGSIVSNSFANGQLPTGWMYSSGQFDAFPIITGGSPYYTFPGNINSEYNFGIQQAPILNNINTNIAQPIGGSIPAGNISAAVVGNDPDGTNPNATNQVLGNSNAYKLSPASTPNGVFNYNGAPVPASGLSVTNFNPALVSFTGLSNSTTSTSFVYTYTDAAGVTSSGTYTVNWATPLPLHLLSFTANAKKCNVILDWQTANEINVNKFEIEKSNNGKTFKSVDEVWAKNNSGDVVNTYHAQLTQKEQTAYYRLKMIDNDNQFSYSSVEIVNTSCNTITLQPTLTSDVVNIKGLNSGETVQVYAVNGKVVSSLTTQSQEQQIHLGDLPAGLYLINISKGNTVIFSGKVSKF